MFRFSVLLGCVFFLFFYSVYMFSYDLGHLLDPRLVEAHPDLFQLRWVPEGSRFVDERDAEGFVQGDSSFDLISADMSSSDGSRDAQNKHVKGVPFYEVVRSFDDTEE